MLATAVFEGCQVKLTPLKVLPFASLATAVNAWVAPTAILAEAGLTTIVASPEPA